MYSAFYGFQKKPFSLLPDPHFLYMGKKHTMAFTMLEYGMMNDATISVITGEIGSGKTTLIRHLLNKVDEKTTMGVINNTQEEMGPLLKWILMAFGLEYKQKDEVEQYEEFQDFLQRQQKRGLNTVLIVDEGQNLKEKKLEELRMISNVNFDGSQLLQLILVGQPQLRDLLHTPELRQFAQRVSVDFHLDVLGSQETVDYIHHRTAVAGAKVTIFTDHACRMAHQAAQGVPRLINTLCDTALVYGFADKKRTIDESLMRDVIRDKSQSGILELAKI
ncbi:MAG: AAA family ATPase [Sedimenticola sp.]